MTDQFTHVDDLHPIESPEQVAALPSDTQGVLVHHLTDEVASALTRLPNLRVLVQNGTPSITDRGLEALGRIRTLEHLDLEWSSAITDQGLRHLASLTMLAFLDLEFCEQLTAEGIRALGRRLPGCSIYGIAA